MAGEALADLRAACPIGGAGPAGEADACEDVPARYLARPSSTAEVAATLAVAAHHRLTVVARGGGTKLDWGGPVRSADLLVDLSGCGRVVDHAEGDLVVTAEAGCRLATLQAALARAGQWLPLDEVVPGSTLGGVLATGCAGPSRHAHGTVRDLVLGVTFVRADGVVARAGGKVVKNVAGYDLAKLLTGAYGTLGVVTEVILRLRPRPAGRRWVVAQCDGEALATCTLALRRLTVAPSAIEIDWPAGDGPATVAVLLEGRPDPLEDRVGAVAGVLDSPTLADTPPPWWGRLPGAVTLKATSGPAGLGPLLGEVRRRADTHGLSPALRASAAGVAYAGIDPADPADPVALAAPLSQLLAALRANRTPDEGTTTVLRGPAPLRRVVDLWGEVPGLSLMERVKDQFDPDRRLAPGRFVGGI